MFERGGQADEGADVFGNRPQQQDGFFAFFFESVQKAGDAQGIAFHPCAGKLEHVETGDVGDGGFGIGDVDGMVLRVQQGEFVDFLAGGEQVAFDAFGKQGERVGFDVESDLFQTTLYPLRQGLRANGFGFEYRAFGGERGEPFCLRLGFFELGQQDQGDGVFGQAFGEGLQRIAAVFAGLAVRNVDFQKFQVGEKPRAACTLQKFVPVGAVVRRKDFAVEVALFFSGGAQGVKGFDAQQVFFAVNDVQRRKRHIRADLFDVHDRHQYAFRNVRRRTIWSAASARISAQMVSLSSCLPNTSLSL